MANTYKHYGVDVSRQVIGSQFTETLHKNGIGYTELPILDHQVFKYSKDGDIKYALIVPHSVPDDYEEAVYITSQTPDDCNWGALMDDIEDQHQGADPAPLKSRLKAMLGKAQQAAADRLAKKYPSNDFMPAELPTDEMLDEIKYELAFMGYTDSDLKAADHHDIDSDFYNSLI